MHNSVGSSHQANIIVGTHLSPRTLSALALSLVFLLKLLVVLQLRDHPLLQPDAGLDTTAYVDLARRVTAGDLSLGPGLYYVSPFYIYFLAAGLGVFHSLTAVLILQVSLGTAAVASIFLMARAWFGERAAWCAAALAALTGLFTFYEAILLQASVDAFLTSLSLLALTRALQRNHLGWMLCSGAVFGLAALNRPNMIVAVAAIGMGLLATRRLRPALMLLAGLVVGMAPVAVRNIVVSHQWTLGASHGGLNFYIGNSATATGFFHPVPGITPNIVGQAEDARRMAERALGHSLNDAQTSNYFFGLAWTWMAEHPVGAVRLFLRKLAFVFNAQHIALPHSYPFYAYDAGTILRVFFVGPWLLLPLGAIGLVWAAPTARRADYLVWATFVPGYAIGVAAFFVAERYRLPLLVPLAIGAGAALDRGARLIADQRSASLAAPVVLFAAAAVFANWPHALHDGRWEDGLRMTERLIVNGRYDDADGWVERILPREPRPGATDFAAGTQLLAANQTASALRHLTRAQSRDPESPGVGYVLGQALLAAGRAADAVPHLRRGFDAGIEIPQGGYDLAVALQATGDSAGAVAVVKRLQPPDSDPEAWLRAGRLATQLRAPDVALPFFRRAVALRPQQASAHQQLGLDLLVLRRYDEAAQALAEAVRLDPGDADTLARLAYCELEVGRTDLARTHARAALALNPNDPLATQLVAALK